MRGISAVSHRSRSKSLARVQEFYRGRRKRRNYAIVPFIILLALIAVIVVLFYGVQKYAVITKDGVTVELPMLKKTDVVLDSSGKEVKVFETVDAQLVFDAPDYTKVAATAGEKVSGVRAIFIPYTELERDKLIAYASRLVSGNALMLEMKPRTGELMWESHADLAVNFSLSVPTEKTAQMAELIGMLKEQDIYLVAQISCCIDELLPTRTTSLCIHDAMGMLYKDENGLWLDPYNLELREYIAQLVQELWDLGFDEVVLADVMHPVLEIPEDEEAPNPYDLLLYTREMSTPKSTETAVCGFALSVAEKLRDREKTLSIYCDTLPSLVKADVTTGQNAPIFLKVYDRVYLRTDKYAYTYNVEDVVGRMEKGSVYDRLVPVVENYIPSDNSSWVLIDVEEE